MQGIYTVSYYEHAEQLKITGFGNTSTNISKRGRIKEFSRKSRQRILRLLSTIDMSKIIGRPIFLTLTYPATYSNDYKDWKRDINVFFKRLYRFNPYLSAIWKLEFQKRGAPHYHIMIFNTDPFRRYINHKALSTLIALYWYEIVGSNDEKHLKAGINYQPVSTYKAVRGYISKYVAKEATEEEAEIMHKFVGRYYGTHNKEALPITEIIVELTPKEFFYLRRIARNYLENKVGGNIPIYARSSGFTIFLDWKSCEKLIYYVKDLEL